MLKGLWWMLVGIKYAPDLALMMQKTKEKLKEALVQLAV